MSTVKETPCAVFRRGAARTMPAFCVPFGLLHHTDPRIMMYGPQVDYAEEAAAQEEVNRQCAEIDEYAATIRSSTDVGENWRAERVLATVAAIEAIQDMFQDICAGRSDEIVNEHARATLASNDAGSLMHTIESALRRWEAAPASESLVREDSVYFNYCLRSIHRYTQNIRNYARLIIDNGN